MAKIYLQHNRSHSVRFRRGKGPRVLKRISHPDMSGRPGYMALEDRIIKRDPLVVLGGEIIECSHDLSKGGPEWTKLTEAQLKELLD